MNSSLQSTLRLTGAALRALLVLTVVLGIGYPLLVTGVAQGVFHDKANGSKVAVDGEDVGSSLIGQSFDLPGKDKGPDPKWFQPRPSNSGYDPMATGSSQLGASDPTLLKMVKKAKSDVAKFNGVPASEVPADAVTGSSSSIDPAISPDYARIQTDRVARENSLDEAAVTKLVKDNTTGRSAGFLGQPTVNVLELNIAVRQLAAG